MQARGTSCPKRYLGMPTQCCDLTASLFAITDPLASVIWKLELRRWMGVHVCRLARLYSWRCIMPGLQPRCHSRIRQGEGRRRRCRCAVEQHLHSTPVRSAGAPKVLAAAVVNKVLQVDMAPAPGPGK